MSLQTDEIALALERAGVDVSIVGSSLNLQKGVGLQAHKVNLEASSIANRDARWMEGFAEGVATVLSEPGRSKAAEWTFERAAGRILPLVQRASFADGVHAATEGHTAFVRPLHDDLIIAFIMELDRGYRAVTEEQLDAWGTTADRVAGAGRSLLFHRTQGLPWKKVNEHGVHQIHKGDGHDAARLLVFEDAYFTEVSSDLVFAIPSPEHFYFVNQDDDRQRDALKKTALETFATAEHPLTPALFRFERGHAIPAEH